MKDKKLIEDIFNQLRQDIECGNYAPLTRLPSVRTLAKRFRASPNTISKVVTKLFDSKYIAPLRGVGIFIADSDAIKCLSAETERNYLRKCPCGETPNEFHIESTTPSKYIYVSGDCCNDWSIEVRADFAEGETLNNIIRNAWNDTPRGWNQPKSN